jgi:hypothetical protein
LFKNKNKNKNNNKNRKEINPMMEKIVKEYKIII